MKTTFSVLNIADIEEDIVFDFDGNPTIGFRINGVDIWLKSESDQSRIIDAVTTYFSQLDEGISLQFIFEKKVQTNLETNILLFASFKSSSSRSWLDDFVSFKYRFKKKVSISLTQKANEFSKYAPSYFKGLGIELQRLDSQALFEFGYCLLNPERQQHAIPELVSYPYEGLIEIPTVRNQLMYADIDHQKESVLIDGYYHVSVNLTQLPTHSGQRIIETLLNDMDINYRLCIGIEIPKSNR